MYLHQTKLKVPKKFIIISTSYYGMAACIYTLKTGMQICISLKPLTVPFGTKM